MAETAQSVVVELRARTDGFDRKIQDASKGFDRGMDRIEGSSGKAERRVRRDFRNIETQVTRSSGQIQSTLRGLAASLATYFSGRELLGLVDSFTRFQNSLKVAGLEGEALANVQEKLRGIGSQYGVELEALASVFNRATLAQNELGASTADIIRLNEIVAASLKVSGTSTQEASGALLQLSQALGSGVVRAEEFNSILEGALPLAQAAARGIDGYAGSVAALRAAVVEGEITSRQFFEGILAGGVQTIEQAENATLTLSGAFTVLRNELTLYVGEASRSNGVTAALSEGIRKLADNLDTIIPALTTIIGLIGARYTGLLLAATGATLTNALANARAAAAATALTAAQARMGPAFGPPTAAMVAQTAAAGRLSVAKGALATSGRGVLALFGGPIPAAILAVGAGLIYLYNNTETAAQKMDRLTNSADAAGAEADRMEATLRAAGIAIGEVETAADAGAIEIDALGDAAKRSERDLYDLEQQAIRTAIALVQTQLQENSARRVQIGREQRDIDRRRRSPELAQTNSGQARIAQFDRQAQEREAEIKELDREFKNLNRQRNAIIEGVRNGIDVTGNAPPPIPTPAAPKPEKPSKTREAKEPTGPTQEEIDFQFAGEMANLEQQILRSLTRFATGADERAELELASIQAAQERANVEIQADENYSQAQKDKLKEQIGIVANLDRQNVELERQAQLEDERLALLQQVNDGELQNAEFVLDQARTSQQRKDAALRILDLQIQMERALLESVLASQTASEADKERAALAIAALEARRGQEQQRIEQGNLGPLESFLDEIPAGAAEVNEALESIAAGGLASVVDGLTDAIVNFKSLKGVALAALQSITASLVRLALQQIILKVVGQTAGNAAIATTGAQAAAAATAWAPAASLASLATLGTNAGPAAVALGSTTALAQAIAATSALGRADGGPIQGSGGPRQDNILVAASNGEYMIRASAARRLGRAALDQMNLTGEIPQGFADGGLISRRGPRNGPAFSGRGGGSSSLDERSLARLSQVVSDAARAMPPVQLYPTLDPAAALRAGLNSPGGQRVMFDFITENSQRFKAAQNQ